MLAAFGAQGATDAPGPQNTTPLSALSAALLDFERQAYAVEETAPAPARWVLYLGDRAHDLQVTRLRLWIDGEEVLNYDYSAAEAAALQNGAWHELPAITLAPGHHALRAALYARRTGLDFEPPRVEVRCDREFVQTDSPAPWILELESGGWLPNAALRLRSADRAADVADARLRAAQFLLADGRDFDAASALLRLQRAAGDPPPALGPELRAALHGLGLGPSEALPQAEAQGADTAAIQQYNVAIARLAAGDAGGLYELQRFGHGKSDDALGRDFRDRANLVLGYAALRLRQPRLAQDALRRVHSPGPYGNPALLGYGWSFLIIEAPTDAQTASGTMKNIEVSSASLPIGALVAPRLTPDIATLRQREAPRPFRAEATETRALRQALVPWLELIGRDPLDPAVQEGTLAVAWALERLGAYQQAQFHYQRAAELLERTRLQLAQLRAHLADGRLAALVAGFDRNAGNGWHWQWANLPDTPETFYLRHLAADDEVLEALRAERTLQQMTAALERHDRLLQNSDDPRAAALRRSLAVLRSQLDAQQAFQDKQLASAAAAELLRLQRQTERYLVEARFALARIYDREPG